MPGLQATVELIPGGLLARSHGDGDNSLDTGVNVLPGLVHEIQGLRAVIGACPCAASESASRSARRACPWAWARWQSDSVAGAKPSVAARQLRLMPAMDLNPRTPTRATIRATSTNAPTSLVPILTSFKRHTSRCQQDATPMDGPGAPSVRSCSAFIQPLPCCPSISTFPSPTPTITAQIPRQASAPAPPRCTRGQEWQRPCRELTRCGRLTLACTRKTRWSGPVRGDEDTLAATLHANLDVSRKVVRPMYTDRSLVCCDCQGDFVFTAGEQEFHASKGFTTEPRRCPACRAARKSSRGGYESRPGGGGGQSDRSDRPMYDAICDECGKHTQLPFQPSGNRPVYCSDCFSQQRGSSPRGGGSDRHGGSRRW